MNTQEFRGLMSQVAQELTRQGHGTWTVAECTDDSNYSPSADLAGPDHARLMITAGRRNEGGRLSISGLLMSRYSDRYVSRCYRANVDPKRGARTIAGEARRRVLNAGYLDELPGTVAEWQQEQAESAQRAAVMGQAAKLFGLAEPGDGPLDLSRFLGKRGEVRLSGYGKPEMSVELHGLDPEAGLAMLRAFAASPMVNCSCCFKYGPAHHPMFTAPGCLHAGCHHDDERGELGSREAVLQYLVKSHSVPADAADAALTEARGSRYRVAEVRDGDAGELLAVVAWDHEGCGEYTVEIARKDGTS